MTPIVLWLIEDDPVYRQAVSVLIGSSESCTLTGTFGSCEAALEALHSEDLPDVVLCDIGLPGMDGTLGAREIKRISPSTQILMLTIHEDDDRIFEAICSGASGYLLKTASSDQILQAVLDIYQGGVPFTPVIARKVLTILAHAAPIETSSDLTDRETEVLQLLSEGSTQKVIAEKLFVSPHTIDTHLRNIYAKLHVHNGFAAVSKAIRERLI